MLKYVNNHPNTTYTDFHDIAEDILTISNFGSAWHDGLGGGVFYRRLYLNPSRYLDNVASRLRIRVSHHSKYTDFHDIDEDVRAVLALGGWCENGLNCGIFDRDLYSDPSVSGGVIASRLGIRM